MDSLNSDRMFYIDYDRDRAIVKKIGTGKRVMEVNNIKFIEQRLDHFNPKSQRQWMMRYMENDMFFLPNSPIYIMVGGQGELNANALRKGFMYELADETNGFMIATEHRYYGESKVSIIELKYLHSKQALQDLKHLINHIRVKNIKRFKKSKVVLIGNQYSASLAVWMKQMYPELVDAVIADTAFLVAKLEYVEYAEQVANNFKKFAPAECLQRIIANFDTYISLLNNAKELQIYSKACPGSDMSKKSNQQVLFYYKTIMLRRAAENGLDEIHKACNYFDMENKYRDENNINMCYKYNYEDVVKILTNKGSKEYYQFYQACNEFATFPTSSYFSPPYHDKIPLEFFIKPCTLAFGYNEDSIENRVAETNSHYGGLKPNVTNVAFVYGEMDPWKYLGIPEINLTNNKVFSMPGESREKFLQSREEDKDSVELINTRNEVKNVIKIWIGTFESIEESSEESTEEDEDQPSSEEEPQDMGTFLELPVDHFNQLTNDTWRMRYLENDAFFVPNSPVYIMVGNHGEMNADSLIQGIMYDLAAETNGFLIATEHRYYGESRVNAEIKFLHTSQALRDLEILLDKIKKEERFQNSKIVLLGEEYGATLAVWMKQRYPNLVDVVIADTALLLAKLEFVEFFEQASKNYVRYAPAKCVSNIVDVYTKYILLLNYTNVLHELTQACPDVDMSKTENQYVMFYFSGFYLKEAAQNGRLGIAAACDYLDSVFGMRQEEEKSTEPECFNFDFDFFVKRLKNREINEHYMLYQSCNEYGSFLTSKYFPEPYRDIVPIEFYIKLCSDVFGYDRAIIESRVKETNEQYGGLNPKVSKVVFVHGQRDPWKYLGITNTTFTNNIVIKINGEAHGRFFHGPDGGDSRALIAARYKVKIIVKQWLGVTESNFPSEDESPYKFLELPVDHIYHLTTDTWQMRYMQNEEFFKPNSPVFIMVGNHGELNVYSLYEGIMHDLAKETNGVLFATEHRYYGQSRVVADLKFLHSTQALHDLQRFLDKIKKEERFQNSKIVLVGEEYGASLAVWMKQSYPSLVDVVIADTAFLEAKLEYVEFIEQGVKNYVKYAPAECVSNIVDAFGKFVFFLNNITLLQDVSKACSHVDMSKIENQHVMFYTRTNFLKMAAQDGPSEIVSVCNFFDAALGMRQAQETMEPHCYNYDFEIFLEGLDDQESDKYYNLYQSCNEFASFITTKYFPKPYTDIVPIEFYVKQCTDLFGYDGVMIESRVHEINKQYGGLNPDVTKVVFVYGDMDPFKYLGITNATYNYPHNRVIKVRGESHGKFLKVQHDYWDSESLINSRKKVKKIVKKWLGMSGDDFPPEDDSPHTNFLKLPVDHIYQLTSDTWWMKYRQNDEFFKPNSPVFIMVGNHGELNDNSVFEGIMYDLAKETNGFLFATEHRYYGQSRVNSEIQFLHSSQALHDLKRFLDNIKKEERFQNSKIVLVGEEHGASLAVWMKQSHPSLVDVVIADTAFLEAKLEYVEFVEQGAKNYVQYAPAMCVSTIVSVFKKYVSLLNNTKLLQNISRACPGVDLSQTENQQVMFYHRTFFLKEAAQKGADYIEYTCDILDSQLAIRQKQKITEPYCFNYDFDYVVARFENEESDEHFVLYQACNEFASFITTKYFAKPYSDMVPLEFYINLCTHVFGYDRAIIESKVNETNEQYGALNPKVTNVVFVNGQKDPWRYLGITNDTFHHPYNRVIQIRGESHGKFLKDPIEYSDSLSLINSRKKVKKIVKKWLGVSEDPSDEEPPDIKFLKLPVDHIYQLTSDTWWMRYRQNDEFFKPNSPVFIRVGNQGELNANSLFDGIMYDLAEETNGFMFATEHRYYGQSRVNSELKFLHTSQVLHDLEIFLNKIKKEERFQNSKIVLIGEGYSASLAVWMKQSYPSLVDVVIAHAALLLAKLDYVEFVEQGTKNIVQHAPAKCVSNIVGLFKKYISLLNNAKILHTFSKACPNVDMSKKENQDVMFYSRAYFLKIAAQNGPSDIIDMCIMLDSGLGMRQEPGTMEPECYDYDFESLLENLENEESDEHYILYQSCNEFASFVTSSYFPKPYSNIVRLEFYIKLCTDIFGYDRAMIESGVNKTNEQYGGLHPNVSKIVFVYGQKDPWKYLGITNATFTYNRVVKIKGESHGRFLEYLDLNLDSEYLRAARKKVKKIVKEWLGISEQPYDEGTPDILKFLKLPVDHIYQLTTDTWWMRYKLNDEFFKPNSPVFIMVGNHGELNAISLMEGIMYDLAAETDGFMFATEHRYYGRSRVISELKFLHTSQVLHDLEVFLNKIKKEEKFQNSKIVLVGEEYGASLAVWMKQSYPSLVDVVIADSALLLAKLEYVEFAEQGAKNIEKHAPAKCISNIVSIFNQYCRLLNRTKELHKMSKACPGVDMSKKENQHVMFYSRGLFLKKACQNGDTYILNVCYFLEMQLGKRLKQDTMEPECYNYEFEFLVDILENEETDDHYILYQTCNEFASFTTTKYFRQPYRDLVPIEFYIKLCSDVFGYDRAYIENSVKETNEQSGGLNPNVTKVVFVYGELDPWKYLGITNATFKYNRVIQIKGESHGNFLRGQNFKEDIIPLVLARIKVKKIVKEWLGLSEDPYDEETPNIKFLKLPVDHIYQLTTDKWWMRYIQNDEFFKPNSPVFIMVGNHGELKQYSLKEGIMYDLAKETNGFMFATEHRYYGKSRVEAEIQFLHSSQALLDLEMFLDKIKKDNRFQNSKIVLVGEEYGASLAVWMKQSQPTLVDVVIADTAYLLAKLEYVEFVEQGAKNFVQYAPAQCVSSIEAVFMKYMTLLNRTRIKELHTFSRACPDVDMSKKENQLVMFYLTALFFKKAAENGPSNIVGICNYMYSMFGIRQEKMTQLPDCFNYNYKFIIQSLENDELDEHYILYQSCNEFASFVTTTYFPRPYKNIVSIEFYIKICTDVFGYNRAMIESRVNETNKQYGGLNPNVTKIVFVHGVIDPNKYLGITNTTYIHNRVIQIKDESHGKFLKGLDDIYDSKSLIAARKKVKKIVKHWLGMSEPDEESPNIKFLELPVDHIFQLSSDTWRMRYMQNDKFFKPKSPVFIMVGNHGELYNNSLTEGIMYDLAAETNGFLIATEHRYYGKSQVNSEIQFLHSSQALHDLKIFLYNLKKDKRFQNSKVVLVGEEYGASLAVWMKQSYPSLVDAVIADSAFLLAKLEYVEFADQGTKNYKQYAPANCISNLENVFQKCIVLLNFTSVLQQYSKACSDVDMSKKENQYVMFYSRVQFLRQAAQTGPSQIATTCNFLDSILGIRQKITQEPDCFNYDFEFQAQRYENEESEDHYILYQLCNEFASFVTTKYFPKPYSDAIVPIDFYIKLCDHVFGYDRAIIEKKVNETNERFGGLNPNVTNVVFVHGEKDPWKYLGITDATFTNNTVIEVEGEFHGKFLKGLDKINNSVSLITARNKVKKIVKQWISVS